LDLYRKLYEEYFAMPVIYGIKSEAEKFAGTYKTYGIESLMPDGKVLQASTSHNLGQNFSKSFDITYQDENGKNNYVWQTSWGLSTRSIGGLILVHGDDSGLVVPPKLAPIQVVIITITPHNEADIKEYADQIEKDLKNSNIRVFFDGRNQITAGRKFNEWEIKGVPLRLEIGRNELNEKTVSIFRRDKLEKVKIVRNELVKTVDTLLEEIQKSLYDKAVAYRSAMTTKVDSYNDFKKIMKEKRGFIKAYWCEDPKCEAEIKAETKATTRVKELNQKEKVGKCVYCGKAAKFIWYFAQSY
jgi:prolyl-tRNA synthetase